MSYRLLRNTSLADLMGTWPFTQDARGSGVRPHLLTGTLLPKARIISVRKEPSSGFILNTLSFKLYIDSHASSPFTITFTGGPFTLDQVVTQINTDASAYGTVAYNDNGFLKLESGLAGEGSYLRLETIDGAEDVFDELGLYSETESYGGDYAEASHIDSTRQTAIPRQASMMHGEDFTADKFNRLAISLAAKADHAASFIDNKRIAVRREEEVVYNGTDDYMQLNDQVYTGPVSPVMEDLIAILDGNYNEVLVEKQKTLVSTFTVTDITTHVDSGEMIVEAALSFAASDETDDHYVVLTSGPTWSPLLSTVPEIADVPLKILRCIDSTHAVVQNVDRDTGARITYNGSGGPADKVQIYSEKVKAAGLYRESSFITDINQYNWGWYSGAVTRVEKNNRIYCAGADFADVVAGDLVVWTGSTVTDPYSNDGTYRVKLKVDRKTLDLVHTDGRPAILNPTESSPSGTVTVQTDGEFWDSPYIKLDSVSGLVVKPPAGTYKVIYLGMSTLRDAIEDNISVVSGNVRHYQEAEYQTQRAILGIVGPSVDTFDEALSWLYGDRRRSLEGLFFRSDYEHHSDDTVGPGGVYGGPGRHSDIRPDTIDMFPAVDGPTVTVRVSSGDSASQEKIVLKTAAESPIFDVYADGSVSIGPDSPPSGEDLYVNRSGEDVVVRIRSADPSQTGKYAELQFSTDTTDRNFYLRVYNDDTGPVVQPSLRLFSDDPDGLDTIPIVAFHEDGKVGIGTETPDHRLEVKGRTNTDTSMLRLIGYDDTHEFLYFRMKPRPSNPDVFRVYARDNGTIVDSVISNESTVDNTRIILHTHNGYQVTAVSRTSAPTKRLGIFNTEPEAAFHVTALSGVQELLTLESNAANQAVYAALHKSGFTATPAAKVGLLESGATNYRLYLSGRKQIRIEADYSSDGDGEIEFYAAGSELMKLDSDGTDARLTVKDDASTVEFTGTNFYYAKSWAEISDDANFVLSGMALEWVPGVIPQVRHRGGSWVAQREVFSNDNIATVINLSADVAWLSGTAPAFPCWAFLYLHPTDGLRAGTLTPEEGKGYPLAAETISGVDTDRKNWIYLGAVWIYADNQPVRRFSRVGDTVYIDPLRALPYTETIFEVDHTTEGTIATGSAKTIVVSFGYTDVPGCLSGTKRITSSSLVLAMQLYGSFDRDPNIVQWEAYNNIAANGRWLSARGRVRMAALGTTLKDGDARNIIISPHFEVIPTPPIQELQFEFDIINDANTFETLDQWWLKMALVGYVEPILRPNTALKPTTS